MGYSKKAAVAGGGRRTARRMDGRQPLFEGGTPARTDQTDEDDNGDSSMTFDRRRSELRLAACAASIYLVSIMKTKLQNLTHTTRKIVAARDEVER
jgi:hypothetical protein